MTALADPLQERRLPLPEFVAMLAMLFAMTAFSIDAMLPAMPEIADELSPAAPNRAQLIVTSFVFGMGLGTFVTGPMSDALGRRRVIIGGAVLYCFGAALAWIAPTLELVVAARILQGLGVAGPRVAALALVRDLYAGRQMARIVSFIMLLFVLVPAVAPLIGSYIIAGFGWRGIFPAFMVFSVLATGWFSLRQAETLPPAARRPMRVTSLAASVREIIIHRLVFMVIVAITLVFASLFATLSSTQQIFDQYFGLADTFPLWFAVIALISGLASVLNARLVMRLGMRMMVNATLAAQTVNSAVVTMVFAMGWVSGDAAFWLYLYWTITVFFMVGLTIGNLNALALEPMGHIAGTAASVVTALATVFSVLVAAPIGLAFNGTPTPLMAGVFICTALALPLTLALPKPVQT